MCMYDLLEINSTFNKEEGTLIPIYFLEDFLTCQNLSSYCFLHEIMPDPPFKHHQENLGEAERVVGVFSSGNWEYVHSYIIFLYFYNVFCLLKK